MSHGQGSTRSPTTDLEQPVSCSLLLGPSIPSASELAMALERVLFGAFGAQLNHASRTAVHVVRH